ncbi:TPA: hypothetical protein HA251_04005 [Candidatus Woesearchaeota archaeon]|nr:hypothetical protein [Candidatus Woesearchaeota archaeon]
MAKSDDNPFEKKEGDTRENAPQKEKQGFLSKANWTPDIVASILATNSGLLLGGALAFLAIYGSGAALQAFSITLVFFCAWFFSITCYHMELDGHRHFQQAYLLLTPILGVFVTITLITTFLKKIAIAAAGTFASSMVPEGIPVPGAQDLARSTAEKMIQPMFSNTASFSDIGGMTIAITIAVVMAFTMTAAHRKMLKWYYLLPALLFIGLGAIIITGGAVFAKI